jgi:hypothetical protein
MAILLRRGFIPDVSTSFLLDNVTATPILAYSTRKLKTGVTASVQLKGSNVQGGTLLNPGFDGNGNLDTSQFSATWGSHDGGINAWLDQSGNGNNANVASNFQNPMICNGGNPVLINGHPCAQFAGNASMGADNNYANTTLTITPTGGAIAQPLTVCVAFQFTSLGTGTGNIFIDQGTGGKIEAGLLNTTQWMMNAGVAITGTTPAPDTNKHSAFFFFNSPASQVASSALLDNVSTIIAAGNCSTGSLFGGTEVLAPGADNQFYFMLEFLIFQGIISAGDQNTIHTSWVNYWGVP